VCLGLAASGGLFQVLEAGGLGSLRHLGFSFAPISFGLAGLSGKWGSLGTLASAGVLCFLSRAATGGLREEPFVCAALQNGSAS
jgi:hypothetical protein